MEPEENEEGFSTPPPYKTAASVVKFVALAAIVVNGLFGLEVVNNWVSLAVFLALDQLSTQPIFISLYGLGKDTGKEDKEDDDDDDSDGGTPVKV